MKIKSNLQSKTISIVGNYSLKNRGDELLLKGTILLFKKIFKENVKFNIFISNIEDIKYFTKEETKNITFFLHPLQTESKRFFPHKLIALIKFLYLFLWSFLFRLAKSRGLLLLIPREGREKIIALINSDYVIYRSIDQISDIFGLALFFKNILQILLYINISKNPVILHAHTIYFTRNSFTKLIGKLTIKYLYKKCKITLRDLYSVKWFKENALPFHAIIPPPSLLVTEKLYLSKSENILETLTSNYSKMIKSENFNSFKNKSR